MEWTKDKPKKEGWYWRRDVLDPIWPDEIVWIISHKNSTLCIEETEPEWDNYEWAGPIPEPKEPKE